MLILSLVWPGEAGFCVLLTLFEHFLAFWHKILYFLILALESAISPEEPCFILVENGI